MNDKQIESFITIAKCGSISKAEEILNTTKTALKKQMDALENDLNFKLFTRTSKGMILTNAGELFLNRGTALYNEMQELILKCQELQGMQKREIRIGIYSVTSLFNWYHAIEQNSSYKIRPIYISGTASTHQDNLNLLCQDKIDFLEYEDNALIFENSLCFHELFQDHLCCIVPVNHPLASKTRISPQELVGYRVYCWTSESSAIRSLSSYAKEYGIDLVPHTYSFNAVLDACMDGNIYVLSYSLASKFEPLKVIPIEPEIIYRRGLAYRPEKETLLNEMLKIAKV